MGKTAIPKSIDKYLDGLMMEHGDNILPGDIQAAIKFDLYQNLNDYLLLNITSSLSAEKLDEFNVLIASNISKIEVEKFLLKNSDYKSMVKKSCLQLKHAYLENKTKAQKI